MSAKNDNIAGDLLRSYNYVRRFVGVLYRDHDGLWVLSKPTFPPERYEQLAELLLSENEPTRHDWAHAIAPKEVLGVSAGKLGRASRHFSLLEDRARIEALIDEGVRPLRSFRGRDFGALVDEAADGVRRAKQGALRDGLVSEPRHLTGLERRTTALFGFEVGSWLASAYGSVTGRAAIWAEQVDASFSDFVAVARAVRQGHGVLRDELRPLWTAMSKLPADPTEQSRQLVTLFRDWIPLQNPHEAGRRRTLEALARQSAHIEDAARNLTGYARGTLDAAGAMDSVVFENVKLLELALHLRHERLPLPQFYRDGLLDRFLDLAQSMESDRLASIWPVIRDARSEKDLPYAWTFRQCEHLPAGLVGDAIAADCLAVLNRFKDTNTARAFLNAAQRVRDADLGFSPLEDWFVNAFLSGRAWESALAASLVTQRERDPAAIVATMTGLREAGIAELGFVQAIEDWHDVRVIDRPADFDDICAALHLTITTAETYLHHRRVSGYGETFSDAVRAPTELAEKETAELGALRGLVDEAEGERRAGMLARIESLEDPERRNQRVESAVRRAQNAFERSLEDLQRESLEATLDRAARQALERLLGHTVAGKLPDRIRSAMMLSSAEHIDGALLRSFLGDVLEGQQLDERPANVEWRDRMRGVFDVDAWLGGFESTIEVAGESIMFETETDPLHVLEMGTYFRTCLALGDGMNQASTLTNALDANKQVIYGRREDGTVVGRKLIAAKDDGGMLIYRTYAFDHQQAIDSRLLNHLSEWAERCGMQPSNEGRPSNLHGGFWYDDGIETWTESATLRPPDTVPSDPASEAEWALAHGYEDPSAWLWLARQHRGDWTNAARANLWIHHPKRAAKLDWYRFVSSELASRGATHHVGQSKGVNALPDIAEAFGLPFDPETVRAFAEATRNGGVGDDFYQEAVYPIPVAFVTVPFGEAVSFLLEAMRLYRAAEVECLIENHHGCLLSARIATANILHASWFANGADVDAFDRLLRSRDDYVVSIGVELARRIDEPGIGRALRALMKEHGPNGQLEFALANQSDDASRWTLENLAGQHPDDEHVSTAIERELAAFDVSTYDSERSLTSDEIRWLQCRAFEHGDDDAIAYLIQSGRSYQEVPLCAWVASDACIERVRAAFVAGDYRPLLRVRENLAQYRPLVRRFGRGARAALSAVELEYREDWIPLLGDDLELWRSWIEPDFDAQSARAVAVYSTLASPSDFERFVDSLDLPTDAPTAAKIMRAVADDDDWRFRSYRAAELLVRHFWKHVPEDERDRIRRSRTGRWVNWWNKLLDDVESR